MLSSHGRADYRVDLSTVAAVSEGEDDYEDYDDENEHLNEATEQRNNDKKNKYLNPLEVQEHMK
jgi:uncharacterized protein HemY